MKGKLAFITSCVLIICALVGVLIYASIDKNSVTEGQFTYHLNEDGASYSVGAAKRAEIGETLVIPETFNGKPVTAIHSEGFSGASSLKTVQIPASVKSIEYEAFKNCTSLQTVSFAEGAVIESIGNAAFTNCDSIKSIKLPNGLENIPYNLFYGCDGLESVEMPSGVEKIFGGAFGYCVSLKEINIPATVKKIGDSAFFNCRSAESLSFGDERKTSSLTSIGRNAFSGCGSIVGIDLPVKIEKIGIGAFSYCDSLEFVRFTGKILREIGASAFVGCTALNAVDVASIANWCEVSFLGNDYSNPLYLAQRLFNNNELVLRLEIPYGVKSVSARAFKNATRIISVTLPRDFGYEAGTIGEDAFRYCYKLVEIHNYSQLQIPTAESELASYGYIAAYMQYTYYWESGSYPASGGLFPYGESGTVYSLDELKDNKWIQTNIYTYGENNEFIFYRYDDSLHFLLGYLGTDVEINTGGAQEELADIVLPDMSTDYEIFTGAFFGQRGIRSVVVSESVNTIWHFAFYSATDLERIYIPKTVGSMGDRLFGKTKDLEVYLEAEEHLVGWKDSWDDIADGIKIHRSQRKEDLHWVNELIK